MVYPATTTLRYPHPCDPLSHGHRVTSHAHAEADCLRNTSWHVPSPVTLTVRMATRLASPTMTLTATPNAVAWEEAIQHVGETTTVCGPVASAYYSSSSRGKPTFLNIGKKHPDPERFTVVIWGRNRSKFSPSPEELYNRKTICVSGEITEYNGVAEIEVSEPGQIVVK